MVYFVQCTITGRVKIGKAKDPERRFRSLKIGSPTRLKLLGAVNGGRAKENRLHSDLHESRLHGEWFAPTDEVRGKLDELGMTGVGFQWEDRWEDVTDRTAMAIQRRKVGARRWRKMTEDAAQFRAYVRQFRDALEAWADLVHRVLRLVGQRPQAFEYEHDHGSGGPFHVSGSLEKDHDRALRCIDRLLDGHTRRDGRDDSGEVDVIPFPGGPQ